MSSITGGSCFLSNVRRGVETIYISSYAYARKIIIKVYLLAERKFLRQQNQIILRTLGIHITLFGLGCCYQLLFILTRNYEIILITKYSNLNVY